MCIHLFSSPSVWSKDTVFLLSNINHFNGLWILSFQKLIIKPICSVLYFSPCISFSRHLNMFKALFSQKIKININKILILDLHFIPFNTLPACCDNQIAAEAYLPLFVLFSSPFYLATKFSQASTSATLLQELSWSTFMISLLLIPVYLILHCFTARNIWLRWPTCFSKTLSSFSSVQSYFSLTARSALRPFHECRFILAVI